MTQHCELIELQPQPTLTVRSRASVEELPRILGETYKAVIQYLKEIGELPHGAPFVAYYNMDMQNLDIEAGFPVGRPLPGQDARRSEKYAVRPGEIPGGQYATTTFTGPYQELSQAYDTLTAWVLENGYETVGVVYEIYLNDPEDTAPSDLKTQLLFRLKA